jgi:7-cyano-7-deazaguanine synthase
MIENKAAIVLFSGGMDSSVCLAWAMKRFSKVYALNIHYGQRHSIELHVAKLLMEYVPDVFYVLQNLSISLPLTSSLSDKNLDIKENGGYKDDKVEGGLPNTYVPGRNLAFLTQAFFTALFSGIFDIVTGVCQTDYSGYPDCREEFIKSLEESFNKAMPTELAKFKIHTPLMHINKSETLKMALEFGCLEMVKSSWSCYNPKHVGDSMYVQCEECPSCKLRSKAFLEVGLKDGDEAVYVPSNARIS